MAGSKKGSAWEREVCKSLSLWWSGGRNDTVFWRTEGSGSWSKNRSRRGKNTAPGRHGDLCAVDPSGTPLVDLLTVELKRGYNSHSIGDLLDRPRGAAPQKYEEWLSQVQESHADSGSYSWLLIHRRDRRRAVCLFPGFLMDSLHQEGAFQHDPSPSLVLLLPVEEFPGKRHLVCYTLEDFLALVSPGHVKSLARRV